MNGYRPEYTISEQCGIVVSNISFIVKTFVDFPMTNPQTKPLSKEYTKDKIPRLKNPKRKFFSPTDTLFFAIDINLLNLFSVNIFSIYELREEEKEVSSIPSHIPNIIPIKYAIRNIKKYNIFLNNYYNYFFRDLL